MSVEKPNDIQKNLIVKEKVLMTAGVTKMSPRIMAAMVLPLIHPTDPLFQQIMKDIVEGIRYVFQTANRYSFAINGPITLAFETVISNLVDPNEKILIVIHGSQGERMAKTTKGLGFKLLRLRVNEPGDLVDKDSIKTALEGHKPKILFLCHGDDSTGTLQPLRGIGALCHENECLFVVDTSSTLCCCPLNSDLMEIDVCIASTDYALGTSPGLSIITFNKRATDIIKSKKRDRISYTMNFDLLTQTWRLGDSSSKGALHFMPSISLMYALRESLAMVVEEGLDKCIARHMKCSLVAQKDIESIGLKFLVSDEKQRLTSVLVILVPDSIKRDAVIEYLSKFYDIAISVGMSPIDRVWRIGILGPNANRFTVKSVINVLREAIEKSKKALKSEKPLTSPSSV